MGMRARVAIILLLSAAGATSADDAEDIEKGRYLFRAAGCTSCHTDADNEGVYLAGGRRLETPFGAFYSPNITPDPETGIGQWDFETFRRAVKEGVAPDGSRYYPVFPYTAYAAMTDEDVRLMKRYLDSVDPVSRANQGHELPWLLRWRWPLVFWQVLFHEAEEADEVRTISNPQLERGKYLVEALGHCGECHSERTMSGAVNPRRRLSGSLLGAEGEPAPNLTPDIETGIGRWSENDIVYYLETGGDPYGDYAGGLMAEVIDNGTKYLTVNDRMAIAAYLKNLPPRPQVVNPAKKEAPRKAQPDPWD